MSWEELEARARRLGVAAFVWEVYTVDYRMFIDNLT
jgi:hypothetical protein